MKHSKECPQHLPACVTVGIEPCTINKVGTLAGIIRLAAMAMALTIEDLETEVVGLADPEGLVETWTQKNFTRLSLVEETVTTTRALKWWVGLVGRSAKQWHSAVVCLRPS